MAQRYVWRYGLDPAKPYSLSIIIGSNLNIDPDDSPTGLNINAGNFIPGTFIATTANILADYVAQNFFRTIQADPTKWYDCSIYNTTTDLDPDTFSLQLVHAVSIPFTVTDTPMAGPDSQVMGVKGRTVASGASRPYAVGLPAQRQGGTFNRSLPAPNAAEEEFFYMWRSVLPGLELLAVSGFADQQKTFTGVNVPLRWYVGVRRS